MSVSEKHEKALDPKQALWNCLTKELAVRRESASAIMEFVRAVLASENIMNDLAGRPKRILRAQDVMEESRLRGEAMRSVLSQKLVNAEDAGELLGSTSCTNRRQYANKYRENGTLLGVPVKNRYLYPVFQFDPEKCALNAVVGRVNKLLDARKDPWGVASWWVTPKESLDGRCPADLIGTAEEEQAEALARIELEPLG